MGVLRIFINDSTDRRRSSIDVSGHYEKKRAALACYHPANSRRIGRDAAVPTRLTAFQPARQLIESRDAQFGALAGVTHAEGLRRERTGRARVTPSDVWRTPAMKIRHRFVTHRSAAAAWSPPSSRTRLALRGHEVHLISSELPFRWRPAVSGLSVPGAGA